MRSARRSATRVASRLVTLLWCAVVLAVIGVGSAASQEAPTPVRVDSGQVQGVIADGVESFKGIPFAEPPVGELRWRPPQPAASWTGVRQAAEFGANCMQGRFGPPPAAGAPQPPAPSEDCLFLNIWRPASTAADAKLPVMVWIHGGGFVGGSGALSGDGGAPFARKGVVLVTLNYRLGRFGFFAHPALSAERPDDLKGNYAYMDQIAALHWVHDNIAAFGGDPGNVTLFGSDAGATSIALLMLSAQARDLFQKAILQSVPGRARLRSAEEAEIVGRQLAAALGPTADWRAAEPQRVLAAERQLLAQSPRSFAPMIDGDLVSEDLIPGFAAGHHSRIALIIGSNDDETGVDGASDLGKELASSGIVSGELRQLYADPSDLAARVYTDKVFSEPVRLLARLHAASGAPTFRYRLAYVPEASRAHPEGGHGRELQFVFGAEGVPGAGILSRRDREVASRIRAYWINFARSGDPNGAGLPRWDNAGGDRLLLITNDGIASGDDPFAERLDRLANEGGR